MMPLPTLYAGFGESKTAGAWARDRRCTVSRSSCINHLKAGWSVVKALTFRMKRGRPAIGSVPFRRNPNDMYTGEIRLGDLVQGAGFVWSYDSAGMIELRSYGGSEKRDAEPNIERMTIEAFRATYAVCGPNPEGRLVEEAIK